MSAIDTVLSSFQLQGIGGSVVLEQTCNFKATIVESLYGDSYFRVDCTGFPSDSIRHVITHDDVLEATIQWGANARSFSIKAVKLRTFSGYCTVSFIGENRLYRLKRRSPQRSYTDMTISDILEDVIGEGSSDQTGHQFATAIEPTTLKYKSLVQGDLTDYEFVFDVLLPRARVGENKPYLCYLQNELSDRNDSGTMEIFVFSSKPYNSTPRIRYDRNMVGGFMGNNNETIYTVPLLDYTYDFMIGKDAYGTQINTFDVLKNTGRPYLHKKQCKDSDTLRTYGNVRNLYLGYPNSVAEQQSVVIEPNPELNYQTELQTRLLNWDPTRRRLAINTPLLYTKIGIGALAEFLSGMKDAQEYVDGTYMVYAEKHIVGTIQDCPDAATSELFLERTGL